MTRFAPRRFVQEPFRVFFASGLALGLAGVSIWPLYQWGWLESPSGTMHARWLIEGFLGPFIIGFLLTALPRLMETSPPPTGLLLVFFLLFGGCVTGHAAGVSWVGDLAFLLILLLLIGFAIRCFLRRKDVPPPFFILLPLGLLQAVVGLALTLWVELGSGGIRALRLGQGLVNEGFILTLIVGIGPMLGPRFLGFENEVLRASSPALSPMWWRRLRWFAVAGLLILLSFVLEAVLWPSGGQSLRALVATFLILGPIQAWRKPKAKGFLPHGLRLSFLFILLGLWGIPLFPEHRVAALHVLFIGGYGLVTLVVATRVILGHSGYEHLFPTRMPFIAVIAVCFMLAMVCRVVSEAFPEHFFALLATGSLLWMGGSVVWACVLLPKLFFPLPEVDGN